MKILYSILLITVLFLAGCTTTKTTTETEQQITKEIISTNIPQFSSSLVPKSDEKVYYVVVGSASNDTVVSIRYFAPDEAFIGSRPWSVGQKCISWDASYDWMSANVIRAKYTVGLVADADISITDTFVTKSQKEFNDYKSNNC